MPKLKEMKDACRACRLGKAHRLPFPGHFEDVKHVGELVHSDIVGNLESSFPDRFKYVSTFLDGKSRYKFAGMMRHRSDVYTVFEGVSTKFRDIGEVDIQKIHSDGAQEYIALQNSLGGGDEYKSFSPPYTPELNGIAERVNRTMVEGALAMLIQANLPSCLWPFAVKHVIYVRNRVPHSATGNTPYSIFVGKDPSLKHVRVFGCKAYVLKLPQGSKFEVRAVEGVYLETLDHGVYRILVTDEDEIPSIVESRHVTFDEFKFPGAPGLVDFMEDEVESDSSVDSEDFEVDSDSDSDVSLEITINEEPLDTGSAHDDGEIDDDGNDDDVPVLEESDDDSDTASDSDDDDDGDDGDDFEDAHSTIPQEEPPCSNDGPQRRYPSRNRRKPSRFMATSAECQGNVIVTTSDEPTLREALNSTPEEHDLWMSAIDEEFQSLESKHTWYPDESPGSQPLPTHPVLKIKRKSDGSVERFKARIVAGGNFQRYGENYKETHAPIHFGSHFPVLDLVLGHVHWAGRCENGVSEW